MPESVPAKAEEVSNRIDELAVLVSKRVDELAALLPTPSQVDLYHRHVAVSSQRMLDIINRVKDDLIVARAWHSTFSSGREVLVEGSLTEVEEFVLKRIFITAGWEVDSVLPSEDATLFRLAPNHT